MSDAPQPYLTIPQAARLLGVAEVTIRRWLDAEKLPRLQPGGRGGRILIPVEALASPRPERSHPQAEARDDDREASLRPHTKQQLSATRRRSGPRAKWRRS